jgi:predicted alpha/beta hydrolase family esterase
MNAPASPTVLIVPGLRDPVPQHWQTLLAQELPQARSVPAMGRTDLDCGARVRALEAAVAAIDGPVLLVAHSGGCIMVAHWAAQTRRGPQVHAALLATPPDFDRPMPEGYPSMVDLEAAGWFPVPQGPLPFPSLVLTSDDDPLGERARVEALARGWGSRLLNLGLVGHLNPASGFGPWPRARQLVAALTSNPTGR